jgi:hypothetical protein
MIKLSISLNHRKIFIITLTVVCSAGVIFFVGITLAALTLRTVIQPDKYFYIMINQVIMNGGNTLSLISHLILLTFFYLRFQLINSWIKNNFQVEEEEESDNDENENSNDDNYVMKRKISKHHSRMIYQIAAMHDSLADSTRKFNRCFAFQMISSIGTMFCINIFSTFAIYRVFVRNDYMNFYKACTQYAWNLYFMCYGLALITISSLVTRAGKNTAALVHKAINFIDDDDDPVIDAVRGHILLCL